MRLQDIKFLGTFDTAFGTNEGDNKEHLGLLDVINNGTVKDLSHYTKGERERNHFIIYFFLFRSFLAHDKSSRQRDNGHHSRFTRKRSS